MTQQGWVSNAFATEVGKADSTDAAGLVLGGEMGPLSGPGRFSAMRDTDTFFETLAHLPGAQHEVRAARSRTPIDHVLATYDSALITGHAIRRKLDASRERWWDFPQSALGEQLRTAARVLDAGVSVPVLKVVQDGYDTHDAQPEQHAFLLAELSQAIAAFANAMRDIGAWDQMTVVTYSEFGRTARENASAGTDHGTAAPVFVAGGRVAGGRGGQRPSLDRLADGEMIFTTDYRSLYGAILNDLWRIAHPDFDQIGVRPNLLRRQCRVAFARCVSAAKVPGAGSRICLSARPNSTASDVIKGATSGRTISVAISIASSRGPSTAVAMKLAKQLSSAPTHLHLTAWRIIGRRACCAQSTQSSSNVSRVRRPRSGPSVVANSFHT